MALLNQIGPFYFLDLAGGIFLPQQDNRLLERPGVPGVGLQLTGARGKPFRLRSRVDVQTVFACDDLYNQYTQIVADGAYPIAQYGNDLTGALGVAVLVQRVTVAKKSSALLVVAGLSPPSKGWLECDWDLVCVQLAQQAGQ